MSGVISGCQDLGLREGAVLSSSGTMDADKYITMHRTVPRNKELASPKGQQHQVGKPSNLITVLLW